MLKVLILAIILLGLGILGIAVKMLFDRKAEFKGSSCASSTPGLEEQGITCGCGGGYCEAEKPRN